MKRKVIALILIIPLIFLSTLFSVGQVASILAAVPVSGIEITTQTDDGFIYLDMATYEEDPTNFIYLEAQVTPSNAKNKEYYFEIEPVEEGEEPADVEIGEYGLLILHNTGKAKITAVSKDNAYRDSIIVNVTSSKVVSILPTLKDKNGNDIPLTRGENGEYNVTVPAGDYEFSRQIHPQNLSDASVTWSTSDSNVMSINSVTSIAKARLSGTAQITVDCDNVVNDFEPVIINVTVPFPETESGISIEGYQNNEMTFNTGTNEIAFLMELETAVPTLGEDTFLNVKKGDEDSFYHLGERYEKLDEEGKKYKVYFMLDPNRPPEKELTFEFRIGAGRKYSMLTLKFGQFNFNVYSGYHTSKENEIYQKKGAIVQYTALGEPNDENVIYEWETTSTELNIVQFDGGKQAQISCNELGSYQFVVKAYNKVVVDGVEEKGSFINEVVKTLEIVQGITSIEFVDNAQNYGIENVLTLGSRKWENNNDKQYTPELKMKIVYDDGTVGGYEAGLLRFESTDNESVRASAGDDYLGVTIIKDGTVTITARWKYDSKFNQEIKSTIRIRGVKDAVMLGVDDSVSEKQEYLNLKEATVRGKKIVLMKDIMLGWENMSASELKESVQTMKTDYDWTYHANLNECYPKDFKDARPTVYYAIEFKNDVYGNGYTINGDYITMARDSVGNPLLFKGPINFVAIETASVKAQDNIVFLVREDGVDINNVNLKGCSDSSLISDDGGLDLTRLNYAGTTLEISADTTLTNSRVSNGRTVVRIFGGEVIKEGSSEATTKLTDAKDIDLDEHRLHARIESCIITNAREFLIKIGSNLSIFSQEELGGAYGLNYYPKPFTKADGSEYELFNNENALDEYFYDNYVITDVTLKDSVLATSGLFTIGMETHFAGNLLAGLAREWAGCAGTSYASVLNMEGSVKMYDWKLLDKVDSSTLIETTSGASEYLALRIDKMLEKVVSVKPGYDKILSQVDGKDYVHGGIAVYGGGRNYSCILMNGDFEELSKFRVNIRDLAIDEPADSVFRQQGEILPSAAGNEDFVFYMYDNNSNFSYEKQEEEMSSGTAYKVPVAPSYGDVIGG